ncbi:hypothetical protein CELD12_00970 [Cellulomonas sp. NTE-D12]|nr:hypothetical protein CELD12_00970 [Cellulomonas sp. NTE-D12]
MAPSAGSVDTSSSWADAGSAPRRPSPAVAATTAVATATNLHLLLLRLGTDRTLVRRDPLGRAGSAVGSAVGDPGRFPQPRPGTGAWTW